MILPFSTQLKGEPTYFVEKIHKSLKSTYFNDSVGFSPAHVPKDFDFIMFPLLEPKHHTIREDKNDRWTPGTKIDFFINCRQKNMFRFAPVLPVVSVQKVEIVYDKVFGKTLYPEILIDNVKLHPMKLEELAQNDGFNTIKDFFAYFNEDFTGKLIHWTDLKY
jgi:hypothetical protein